MKVFNVPGVAWLAALTFVSGWLSQYFGEYAWTSGAIVAIGGIVKMLQMMTEPTPPAPPPGVMGAPMPEQEKPNPVARWLVG